MSRVLRRDLDPNVAPDKTAQDLLVQFRNFCRENGRMENGFLRKEAYQGSRVDDNCIRLLMRAALSAGHFLERGHRLYPQSSFFTLSHVDIMGETEINLGVVHCHSAPCQEKNDREFCWRHECSVCGVSSTHWNDEEEAERALMERNFHRKRKSHSLELNAVLT